MKIKHLNKIFITILTVSIMILSALLFSACDKGFQEKDISIEQASILLNDALTNAKACETIYEEYCENGQKSSWNYVNSECVHFDYGDDSYGNDKEWTYIDTEENDGQTKTFFIKYCYSSSQNSGYSANYYYSNPSLIDHFYNYSYLSDIEDFILYYDFTAKQTNKNEFVISFTFDTSTLKIKIVDGYIVSQILTDESYDGYNEIKYEYNVNKNIPALPDIAW